MGFTANRNWIIVVLAAASLIAATPVEVPTPALPDVQVPAIDLTATDDPSGSLQDVFNALTFLGGDQATFLDPLAEHTLNLNHDILYFGLTATPPVLPVSAEIVTLVNFLSSPLSGALIGLVGPIIAPGVALLNSIEAVVGALGTSPLTALADLALTPFNVVNGFLNGAILNLNPLIPLVEQANLIPLPPGFTLTINDLSIAFGGLFNSGEVISGFDSTPPIGGSIFNSVGLDLTVTFDNILNVHYAAPAIGVGPVAGLTNLVLVALSVLGLDGDPGDPLAAMSSTAATAVDGLGADVGNLFDGLLNLI